jgi:oligo-1,6-glucosidase/alpha-glucosidase
MSDGRAWWKESVFYQIYPKSFRDGDGDGVGDLQGIVEQLDYIDDLGVDAVWLTPVYESPQEDNGYDVADYRSVGDLYGSMDDWDRLLAGLHERDIRLVMDLVVNHTSDRHDWFQRSREDPDGPYGDFYVWVDGDPDEPPNNWRSAFGGPAWEYDDLRGAWYLHLFDVSQPDLNWDTPAVRREVADLTNWWLEKGIDGFRMDVINLLSKPDSLPDGDPAADWTGAQQFVQGPDLVEYLRELHDRTFANYDAVTIGETPGVTVEQARRLAGEDGPLDMVFGFDHVQIDFGERGRWDVGDWSLSDLTDVLARWQRGLGDDGWNTLFFENHDQPRSVSRFGDDTAHRFESATMLGTLLMTLEGTPFVYQGQEIGMTNSVFESFDDVRDVDTINNVRELMVEEGIEAFDEMRALVEHRSRDNARTPMQWDDSAHAGFTDGTPWIDVNPNHTDVNVAEERARERSVLRYYRELIDLRHERDVLVYGDFEEIAAEEPRVFAFSRTLDGERVAVVLNLGGGYNLAEPRLPDDRRVLLSNYDVDGNGGTTSLYPYEARVYDCPLTGSGR